ncbi:uncharacterized protein LOC135688019 isoform X3 [Rhopilema esculentum]|uniref:uncharacterized protein LOC135688019 isoform X3 n=1 Tax=Rhopilema esculentum TaxID=499914 RepID=UPI0031DF14C2
MRWSSAIGKVKHLKAVYKMMGILMKIQKQQLSIIGLLLVAVASSQDLTLLKWSNGNENYCLTGENLNMNASSRLVGYIGDCCQYPKFKLVEETVGKFRIYDANQKTCLASSQHSNQAVFTDIGANCGVFIIGSEVIEEASGSRSCLVYDPSTLHHTFQACLSTKTYQLQKTTAQQQCAPGSSNANLTFHFANTAGTEYCWSPQDNGDFKGKNDVDCCIDGSFSYIDNHSLRYQKGSNPTLSKCVSIADMPSVKYSDLNEKKLQVRDDCAGVSFAYSQASQTLKFIGTDYCVSMNSNNKFILLEKCTSMQFIISRGFCQYNTSKPVDSTQPTVSSSTSDNADSTQPTVSSSTSDNVTVANPFPVIYDGDPVHGNWAQWTQWSSCSVNCGNGTHERTRYCDNPAPKNGGTDCVGTSKETKPCILPSCSGTALSAAGSNCATLCQSLGLVCTTSINTGNSKESLIKIGAACSSDESAKVWTKEFEPAYATTSDKCTGYVSVPLSVKCDVTAPALVKRLCNCVKNEDKGFGQWTPWSECTVTCSGGTKARTRLCIAVNATKDDCQGVTTEVSECNTQKCPVDGGFSEWSKWTTCTKSCDGGTRTRNRTCSDPFPNYHGIQCYGSYRETELCNLAFCPINGGWTDWTSWQHCNKPCNTGERLRQRWCENPLPMYGGKVCEGSGTETDPCNTHICPNVSITLRNVAFDEVWKDGYALASGAMFADFARNIDTNVKRLYVGDLGSTYEFLQLHGLRKGSVIASFTLYFNALDSFQALFLMDAIDNDHYLGKLPIVENKTASFSSPIVPSSPPSNVTAASNDASSIDVSWNEVPSSDQNGVITGYLVFYRESSATTYTIAATAQLKLKIQGLSAATSYSLRVLAYNSNGNGIASELITLTTREKAPSLPPQSISVVPMSAFSLFVEWTHPPWHSWNGIIAGYKVDIKSDDGSFSQSLNVDGTMVNMNVNGLSPDRLYIVDVCASTSVGTGPCIRSYNETFVSTPSISPANAGCQNRTSTSSIIVSYEPIPIAFIHGILKGYRIEYRLMSVGSQSKSNSNIQAVTVSPFRKQATLEKLEPNSVYEIRVMAVNEHGAGVKSPVFYGETCSCPEVIYTNYAALKPYIYRDTQGNMVGIFENLLKNITSAICGLCNGRSSRIDFINDGKNGWAEKQSIAQVAKAIDDYVHLSFAIAGREEMPTFLGKPYSSLIDHPGMVLYTPRPTMSEQVEAMLTSIFQLWPIFILNAVFIIFAGVIFFTLTYDEAAVDGPCWFVSGSLRGMYWAYVTMFTHGYGDIVPSSIVSRIFAVLWILVGLVTSAILIGGISTALTASSTLPGVKLYNTELAVVQGSKEEIVGILRNAKVNTKGQYGKTEDVFHALKERQVEAALVDAFVAASRSDLFEDQAIIARKMIKYSYTYGVVLSGAMKNTGTSIKNYVSDNRQYITQMVEKTAPQLTGTFAYPQPVSLFEPSSPFLSQTLIALFIVYILLFIAGSIFSYVRRRKRGKVDVTQQGELENVIDCEVICKRFFSDIDTLCSRLDSLTKLHERNINKVKLRQSKEEALKITFVKTQNNDTTDVSLE